MQKLIPSPPADQAALPRRGRPRAFDREAALAKATRLFWEKGYEATSISDLTAIMGIAAPSLYAAFGSKEALFAEALKFYCESNSAFVWENFFAADTAREAVRSFLVDSAAALTGAVADIPRGCMVTLSSVGSEGHAGLGELVQSTRAATLERLMTRLGRALEDGEIPPSANLLALARFVQTVQAGMSILARDGASTAELNEVAVIAMLGWDARLSS